MFVELFDRARSQETVAVSGCTAYARGAEPPDKEGRTRLLDGLWREPGVCYLIVFTLVSERLAFPEAAYNLEPLVATAAALLSRYSVALELFDLIAVSYAQLKAAPRDYIYRCAVLGNPYGIVKRHEHDGRADADRLRPRGYGGRDRHNGRGEAVVVEVVLLEPDVVEAVLLGPCDLIQCLRVYLGVWAPSLWGIAEVVPETETEFLVVVRAHIFIRRKWISVIMFIP